MYVGSFYLRGEIGFLNCDDICMCVLNKQFELFEFVFKSLNVDYSIIRFLTLLLVCLCACVVCVFRW